MPFDITCPSCGESVAVADEHRGWTVRCPVCSSPFQAGQTSAPTPALEERPGGLDGGVDVERYMPRKPDRDEVLRIVAGPAQFLEIVSWLTLLGIGGISAFFVILGLEEQGNPNNNNEDPFVMIFMGICLSVIGMPYFAAMAYGARKLRTLSSYNWAMAASILGTIGFALFGVCGILMTPAGIWALVVLNRPEVRNAFNNHRRQSPDSWRHNDDRLR